MPIKCYHENCNGTLVEKPDEKTGPNVFECNSCHCIYRLMTVRKTVDCPSLIKGVQPSDEKLLQTIQNIRPRRRGRPKGSKNKK